MIPTMILLGLLLGRWWKTALVVSPAIWLALLVGRSDVLGWGWAGAAGLGLANAAVGVLFHQACVHLFRRLRTPAPATR